MALPVSEAERTSVGARDRFRKVAQAALERFLARVMDANGQHVVVVDAGYDLRVSCKEAAEEYRKNLRAPEVEDPAELTCSDL